nr:putative ribonuclease h protein [Quercus suber]
MIGWVKLNTDGAMFGNPIKAGGGGVLWDSNGNWVAGFMRKLGSMSSILAKLWALKDGLLLARQLDILNVNIELDADVLVHLLNNPSSHNLMLEPLLNDCRTLVKAFPSCIVTHIFREANRCADLSLSLVLKW